MIVLSTSYKGTLSDPPCEGHYFWCTYLVTVKETELKDWYFSGSIGRFTDSRLFPRESSIQHKGFSQQCKSPFP